VSRSLLATPVSAPSERTEPPAGHAARPGVSVLQIRALRRPHRSDQNWCRNPASRASTTPTPTGICPRTQTSATTQPP